ncbi:2-amino-4-hydroxy-6-hydroxymethyldihydropteridinepyrophosphokinase [Sodalis glossinidius str. 'morsitans']|uniref:2-amino-4-hydroxy-6-hydroxymethyldihydropteridine pyrophosphokinase n=1 Tax=Sodalis glossinidius (strain morsitans) TaxID=343509 RepID=Q2NVR1_SODGM|nr:2-amino-4-hydroxy-6-hydroxymethyldihydropteridine diphosphokinase [Sodalis glossinidius]BAE73764.1 7,8-dihydro-6-hydroxymethylpterin-pyrophosphokinase [Sodalis glossinidius str. 'morsitans']CRL44198.1 2-amino-4-hydroxy-6-hydroxymethyldihydropteridinepyrophosphokinase [Sodalis glossinidius str. 'morsitans']
MECVWLALGSNLAEPLQQVSAALVALASLPQTRLVACSSYYRSRPLGPQDQPDFLNAVVALNTTLAPETLLDHTQAIELRQGRTRKADRFGPRTLDLDILLFGERIIATSRLTVPHYDMHNREFMLYPLAELAPDLQFPNGVPLAERLRQVPRNGLTYWDEEHSYHQD